MRTACPRAFFCVIAASDAEYQPVGVVQDENETVYRDYVDIGIAVASPKGLVLPVRRALPFFCTFTAFLL